MEKGNSKVEITLTHEEKAMLDLLSRQCKMSSPQLVRTILFDSGILVRKAMVEEPVCS